MKTSNQKELIANKAMIAFCGLYCGACPSYLKGKCPGCRDNVKATWCKVRQCCLEIGLQSCADCTSKLMDYTRFNNPFARFIGFVLNSDRKACIERIKEKGYDHFATEMTNNKTQTIKRR